MAVAKLDALIAADYIKQNNITTMQLLTWSYGMLLICLITLAACTNPPAYPSEPVITYRGVNQLIIPQGNQSSPRDTLIIFFDFTDGDGDLGNRGDSVDVFLRDSRDDFPSLFKLPFLPESNAANGISGTISLLIVNKLNLCCYYPDGSQACQPHPDYPTDEFSYFIQIRDRANNYSNTIETETITLLCD